MSATVNRPSAHDFATVARNMRDSDLAEFLAVSFAEDREALADDLTLRYGHRDDLIAGYVDGEPVAVGAAIEARPNVLSLLFFATDGFPRAALTLTRFITRELFPRSREAGVHRIEAISIEGNASAHRWIETLGLSIETPIYGHGKDGQTFLQFAWIAGHVRPSGS
jgi:hypothetical protein